jgi:lysyl-tRNA synthetase class 1
MSNRFDLNSIKGGQNWADAVADEVIAKNPNLEVYTVAAGISPSGTVHFGNFRDVITSHMVRNALIKKGKKTRMIFSWDNFDRMRKVPVNVPESFSEHIGKALSKVPSPAGGSGSYAQYFQAPFVDAMKRLDIDMEFKDQTSMYESGVYDDQIKLAMQRRGEIAEILVSFMTEKAIKEKEIDVEEYKRNYYPIDIYSRFSGKDAVEILSYDEDMTVTYRCLITKKEETVNLREVRIAKLNWKVDWPMRWKYEGVVFEPGGQDHGTPGGSYDTASVIAKKIFNYEAPVFVTYLFVGIRGLGAKMSGSKGNAVSPADLLDIYTPDLLKWMYSRKSPNQTFELAFDSEIFRQYDEYDKEMGNASAISFRQAVGLGQVVQWDVSRLMEVSKELNLNYDVKFVEERLPFAKNWLFKYNESDLIVVRNEKNMEYFNALTDERKDMLKRFVEEFKEMNSPNIPDLEFLTYKIPKRDGISEQDLKKEQRTFFKDIYMMLIDRETGPRLGTFLWSLDKQVVIKLLS